MRVAPKSVLSSARHGFVDHDWTIISIRTTRVDSVQFPEVPDSARQLPPVLRRHRRLGAMSSQIFGLVRHANYRQFGNAKDQNSP